MIFLLTLHIFDYLPLEKENIEQSNYYSFRLGVTERLDSKITDGLHSYYDFGWIGIIPHKNFSDKKFQSGFYGIIGIEALSKCKSGAFFVEGGLTYIKTKAEKVVGSPKYAKGFQFSFGFRHYIGK